MYISSFLYGVIVPLASYRLPHIVDRQKLLRVREPQAGVVKKYNELTFSKNSYWANIGKDITKHQFTSVWRKKFQVLSRVYKIARLHKLLSFIFYVLGLSEFKILYCSQGSNNYNSLGE